MSLSRKIEAVFAISVMLGVGVAGAILVVTAAAEALKLAFGTTPPGYGPPLLRAAFGGVLLFPMVRFARGVRQGIRDAQW